MALNDVRFVTTAGGLGRLPAEKDYVSAIMYPFSSVPAAWSGVMGKKYLSVDEAEADGITEADANYGLLHYWIKDFFRVAGASELWIVNASDASFSAQTVYALTSGELRQAYWYTATDYSGIAAQVGTIKAFADALSVLHAPVFILTSVKDETTAVNGTLQTDLRTLNSQEVGVLICGAGAGEGKDLATSLGIKYVPAAGAVLGAMAYASVHENIGWVAKFNLTQGDELESIVMSDGQAFGDIAASALDTLNTKGYVFLRNHAGISGAYVNDTHTATVATSDYATIENNRTIHKAKRGVRTALLPQLNSPLTVNIDGTLSASTVKYFENLASRPLTSMQSAGEVSNFSVTIDPAQDVLGTSELLIVVKVQPRGVARTIKVTIGYEVNIA